MRLRRKQSPIQKVARYVAAIGRTLTPRRKSALKRALAAMKKLYDR